MLSPHSTTNPHSTMHNADNRYDVPKKEWKKWNEQARHTFNTVYSTMFTDPGLFVHPKVYNKQDPCYSTHWATTCWNAAWTAATSIK